jgi:hypothetical protein
MGVLFFGVREIVVTLGKPDDAVHVIGQHHPGVDAKRSLPLRAPHRLAQASMCSSSRSERRSSRLTVKK